MYYNDFLGNKVSALGFGAMRLPEDDSATEEMVDICINSGINYFDTAYPYCFGKSELLMGKLLTKYPRESYYLADKYPGHQPASSYNPAEIFEEQLTKCRVDYFDYYLLHNVCENSIGVYEDPQWGIIDYFVNEHKKGRIRHLGFSSHGKPENLSYVLSKYGDELEFCQIQLNYLDWSLQEAEKKDEMLTQLNKPVIAMEPLRGGKLAESSYDISNSFRFLQGLSNCRVVLSGMSSKEQLLENIEIFNERKPLGETELSTLFEKAEGMKQSIPCTGCRYCVEGCPAGLDIPELLKSYNDVKFAAEGFTVGMMIDSLPPEKRPGACLSCGKCSRICPQGIDIPAAMADFSEKIKLLPDWAAVCRERERIAKANKCAQA